MDPNSTQNSKIATLDFFRSNFNIYLDQRSLIILIAMDPNSMQNSKIATFRFLGRKDGVVPIVKKKPF